MKKRLRKKLRLGEFQALCFPVSGALVEGIDRPGEYALVEDFQSLETLSKIEAD